MSQKSSWSGDHYIGAHLEAFTLLFISVSIRASINRHAAHRHEIGKSLKLTVDLLGKLARGSHHHAIHRVIGISAIGKHIDNRKEISGCFSCSCLGTCQQVPALHNHRNRLLLNRSAFIEMHVPQTVEHVVVGENIFKFHFSNFQSSAKLTKIYNILRNFFIAFKTIWHTRMLF